MEDKDLLIVKLNNCKTNHILHLILTLITGFWIIVWIIVGLSNYFERKNIENKINRQSSIKTFNNEEDFFYYDKDVSEIKNIKDIPYQKVNKFWGRTSDYITIKKYDKRYVNNLLNGKMLDLVKENTDDSRYNFEGGVVFLCIENMENIFSPSVLKGVPYSELKYHQKKIIHEIYIGCIKINPFLDFDLYNNDFTFE